MANQNYDYRRDSNVWFDGNDLRNYNRYQVVLFKSGLSDDERSIIPNVVNATNAREVLSAANSYLNQYERQTFRCSYNTKDTLEAVAIAAEADLAGV